MPDRGPAKPLSAYIDVKHGFAFEGRYFCDEPTTHVLVTPGNFAIGGGFQEEKAKFYNGPIPQDYILREGDLVVTMTDLSKAGDTLGYPALIPTTRNRVYLHNQRIGLVSVIDHDQLDRDYLYYLLRTDAYRNHVLATASGSTVRHTSPSRIREFVVDLPTLKEQQAVAEVLSAFDDKIEQNRRTGRALERLARATFKAWFVDFEPVKAKAAGQTSFPGLPPGAFAALPDRLTDSRLGPIPQGWAVKTLDDVLLLQRGFDLPKVARSNGPFPVYAASGLNGWHNESKVKGPGVTTGRSGILGQVFFADRDFWPLNTSLWVKEYRRSNPWHAYYFLQTVGLDRFNAGSAVPTLNRNHLREIPAVLAPSELLEAFAETCGRAFELLAHFEAESSKLAALRDYLLPRLLSGRVRVSLVGRPTREAL